MKKKAKILVLILLAALIAEFWAPAHCARGGPGEIKVVASGVGFGLEDPKAAESQALKEALRSALEQAAGRLVPPDNLGKFYPLIAEELLTEPRKYISGYGVVAQSEEEGRIRVTVSTIIPIVALRDALQALGVFVPEEQRPKVLLCVAERPEEESAFVRWWSMSASSAPRNIPFSERLAAALSGRGLNVLPLKREKRGWGLTDDPLDLGRELGAAAVVTGEVTLKTLKEELPSAAADLKVLSVQGGDLMVSLRVTQEILMEEFRPPGWSVARALANRVGPPIASRIRERFMKAEPAEKMLTLGITGLGSLAQYEKLKKFLREDVPQIQSVREKTVGPGRALMEMDAVGGQLLMIKEALKNASLDGFTLKVKEVSPRVLEAEVVALPYSLD